MGNNASPTSISSGSIRARLTIDSPISTTTPSDNGRGIITVMARSTSASAWARSCPVGWEPKYSRGTRRYVSVMRRNHVRCMPRAVMLPK